MDAARSDAARPPAAREELRALMRACAEGGGARGEADDGGGEEMQLQTQGDMRDRAMADLEHLVRGDGDDEDDVDDDDEDDGGGDGGGGGVSNDDNDKNDEEANDNCEENGNGEDAVDLRNDGGREPRAEALWAPGRIEIVGKHTDYARGKSLVCAIDRGLAVAFSPRRDARLRVQTARKGVREVAVFEFSAGGRLQDPGTAWAWTRYVSAVIAWLHAQGKLPGRGFDVAIVSSLPEAAGLSSSSALVCAIAAVLTRAGGSTLPVDALGQMERMDVVGTKGGSQDHAAIMLSAPEELLLLDYAHGTTCESRGQMPESLCFVVLSSGVHACKTSNALERYNRLAGADDAEKVARAAYESQVVVPQAFAAFASGDRTAIRHAILLSQAHAHAVLETTVPETHWLVRQALALGAVAASCFGAGFGGAVYAVVDKAAAAPFARAWRSAYHEAFPGRASDAEAFITRPSAGLYFFGRGEHRN